MIVTFEDYLPVPRYDGLPFTSVRILEAATEDGVYAEIATIPLTPVDPDPANPLVRNFTTEAATGPDLWYKIAWRDADGDEVLTEPVQNVTLPALDYAPTIREVAAYLHARTKDANGVELGTWTANTRPTAEQVEHLIRAAATDVTADVGDTIPAEFYDEAKDMIAIATAMRIELSYYPEQVRLGRSPYPELKELYDGKLEKLILAIKGDPDTEVAGPTTPVWSFHDNGLAGAQPW